MPVLKRWNETTQEWEYVGIPASLLNGLATEGYVAGEINSIVIESLLTNQSDTYLVLRPDGLGGVAFGSPTSVNGQIGDITLAATDVGADPVGSAASAQTAAEQYADQVVAALVDSSPAALDTLNELAAALGNDPEFATTVNAAIAERLTPAQADLLYDAIGSATTAESNANTYTNQQIAGIPTDSGNTLGGNTSGAAGDSPQPDAVAVHGTARAYNVGSVAVGKGSSAQNPDATAIGHQSTALANATAIGPNAWAGAQNSAAIGANAVTFANGQGVLGTYPPSEWDPPGPWQWEVPGTFNVLGAMTHQGSSVVSSDDITSIEVVSSGGAGSTPGVLYIEL